MSTENSLPKPRLPRPWCYSLRTLFALVTLLCLWLGWNAHLVRERRELLQGIDQYFERFSPESVDWSAPCFEIAKNGRDLPLTWRLFRVKPCRWTRAILRNVTEADFYRAQKLLPEMDVTWFPLDHPSGTPGLPRPPGP